jgi:hypothetical protein
VRFPGARGAWPSHRAAFQPERLISQISAAAALIVVSALPPVEGASLSSSMPPPLAAEGASLLSSMRLAVLSSQQAEVRVQQAACLRTQHRARFRETSAAPWTLLRRVLMALPLESHVCVAGHAPPRPSSPEARDVSTIVAVGKILCQTHPGLSQCHHQQEV